jgi:hypothetical protein
MLPEMRATIPRMGQGLPDKQRAANTIRQPVPLSGQAEPDRPLMLVPSRNRPAAGASSNEGGREQRGAIQAAQGLAWDGFGKAAARPS